MGVTKTTTSEGNGPFPKAGDTVTMLYTGYLKNADGSKGKVFDTTEKPGRGPFQTPIGIGRVIKGEWFDGDDVARLGAASPRSSTYYCVMEELTETGWDEGVVQMKLGEKATLDITSDFAYGSQSIAGLIPANSDLIL